MKMKTIITLCAALCLVAVSMSPGYAYDGGGGYEAPTVASPGDVVDDLGFSLERPGALVIECIFSTTPGDLVAPAHVTPPSEGLDTPAAYPPAGGDTLALFGASPHQTERQPGVAPC